MTSNLLKEKKCVVCDLDGTLAESKEPIDARMARLTQQIIRKDIFAVLGGGDPSLFFAQVVEPLLENGSSDNFHRLGLFPTSGACGYAYQDDRWKELYAETLHPREIAKVLAAFETAFANTDYRHPEKRYGTVLENRGTAVVFSAVGQQAPLTVKREWNKRFDRRRELQQALETLLPKHEVVIGGLTSIDVTRKGVDKAFGIQNIKNLFSLKTEEILFLGDALFPGGNDERVKRSGVDTHQVNSPDETAMILQDWIASRAGVH